MAASTAVTVDDTPAGAPPSERAARVAALTGLRGLAALMVVLVHVSGRTRYEWLGLAHYGPVTLFVLSGYLLYRPWARWTLRAGDAPGLRVFGRRRLARIFPAYLVVLVLVALVYPPSRPEGAEGWLLSLTLTWIYVPGHFPNAMAQTWSLATELSWYVALPVMAGVTGAIARRLSPRRGFWLSVGLMSMSVPITAGWRWWIERDHLGLNFTYSFWFPGFMVCFAGGALVALVGEGLNQGLVSLPRFRRLTADPWALLLIALAAALVSTSALGGPDGYVPRSFSQEQVRFASVTLLSVTLLIVVVFSATNSPLSLLLSTRWFVAIGRWSYGIYLWHLPLIVILEDHLTYPSGPFGLVMRLAVILAISIVLAGATHVWVEKPAIAWSHQAAGATAGPDHPDLRRDTSGRADATMSSAITPAQQAAPTTSEVRSDAPGE